MLLQVPLRTGSTRAVGAVAAASDYFEFGWDLGDLLREARFDVDLLVPARLKRQLEQRAARPIAGIDEFDVVSMFARPIHGSLTVATEHESEQLGFVPAHQHVAWDCRRP